MAIIGLLCGALIGVVLGRRFKVAILVPASLASAVVAFFVCVAQGQPAIVGALLMPLALQVGYFLGLMSMPTVAP